MVLSYNAGSKKKKKERLSVVKSSLCFWVVNQPRSLALTEPNTHAVQFALIDSCFTGGMNGYVRV